MPSSIAVQSSLPSSHAARRALRGLENTTPSLFSPSKLKVHTEGVSLARERALVVSLYEYLPTVEFQKTYGAPQQIKE